ncbi:MAG: in [Acidobacteriota bacterium]|jgi:subtilisin|nr:in [Acidobacteriota bacterium]
MAPKSKLQQFIVLPPRGIRISATAANASLRSFLTSFPHADGFAPASNFVLPAEPRLEFRVLDTVGEDGAKLVEMPTGRISDLRAHEPGLRIAPVVLYRPARASRPLPESKPKLAATAVSVKITLKVVSQKDGSPISGAKVVAFTDFEERIGFEGQTNSKGAVQFSMGASSKKLDRLYVYPPPGFWPALRQSITVTTGTSIDLTPIDLSFTDALRHFYGNAPDSLGGGIKVAVIDTGIGPHGDLTVDGGLNTVLGEAETDFGDNGDGHGTHVAGIIAARGLPPSGIRGLAPAVTLRSYRVFAKGDGEASNFSIAKAIDRAVQDGCDLINMSLSGGSADPAVEGTITDARSQGSLVLAAAGNEDRSPVGFPASASLSLAISALGRKGTFPEGASEFGSIAKPFGNPDQKNFIASFSNIGDEIDLTAPGVGILSTVPGGYAPEDGTSMACPAVTGMAARLLAARADILAMTRDSARSDAMAKLLLQSAKSLGFGATFEGQGIL